jgi:hypothetical protein
MYNGRKYNCQAVESVSKHFGVTKTYVRKCLRNEAHSDNADSIRQLYNNHTTKLKQLLNL